MTDLSDMINGLFDDGPDPADKNTGGAPDAGNAAEIEPDQIALKTAAKVKQAEAAAQLPLKLA